MIFLVVAVIGSIAFTAYFLTVREATQIPLLASRRRSCSRSCSRHSPCTACGRSGAAGAKRGNGGRDAADGPRRAVFAAIAAAGAAAGAIILFQLATSRSGLTGALC